MNIEVATLYKNMTGGMFAEFTEGLGHLAPDDLVKDLLEGKTVEFTSIDGELDGKDFVGITKIRIVR